MGTINNDKYKEITKVRLRFARMSARKARFVIDTIRGKPVKEALINLNFINRPSSAPAIAHLLKSAVDSAAKGKKYEGDTDELIIAGAYVDGGPTMKRFMPRAFGRAFPIRKRSCHITLILSEEK